MINVSLSRAFVFPFQSNQKEWSTRYRSSVPNDVIVLQSVAAQSAEKEASESLSAGALRASPLLTTATYSSPILMDPIVNHPSVKLLELERRPRKKLKPRHKPYFLSRTAAGDSPSRTAPADGNDSDNNKKNGMSLFEKLAVACCDSGVVPRKEFFETYASARLIQESFPETIHRVADLAAGHGLLSWMLLALDEYREDGSPVMRTPEDGMRARTAICVDRRMPPSAIAIARSMRKHLFPTGEDGSRDPEEEFDESVLYDRRWTYVQTDLRNVVVDDASTLLVSVHACGTLSDFLIDMAISARRAPLALVPCCHTYSIRKGYAPHPRFSGTTASDVGTRIEKLQDEAIAVSTGTGSGGSAATKEAVRNQKTRKKINRKFQIVENVIDDVRLKTLRNAGYGNVRIASLPSKFTERNRLFIVQGRNTTQAPDSKDSSSNPIGLNIVTNADINQTTYSSEPTDGVAPKSIRKGSMLPRTDTVMKKDETQQQQKQQSDSFSAEKNDAIALPFTVPLRDDPQSIQDCLSVSGKLKAIQRLRELLPNHFAPKLDVSLWLPQTKTRKPGDETIDGSSVQQTNVTLQVLQEILDGTVRSYRLREKNGSGKEDGRYRCTISRINDIFVHPESGRVACTYQIEYTHDSTAFGDDGAPFRKEIAKELHKSFCENVERTIDGIEVR